MPKIFVIIEALWYLLLGPCSGLGVALAITFSLHWASGEGEIIGSGNPWMMIGGMLIVPLGVLIGAGAGLCMCLQTIVSLWKNDDAPPV